jgi:hypothetical protein
MVKKITIKFQLSGMGNKVLEEKIINAVKKSCYSDDELTDIRIPAEYNYLFHLNIFNKILLKYTKWYHFLLLYNIKIFIKTLIKKFISIFKI